jgi:hypothetical protein
MRRALATAAAIGKELALPPQVWTDVCEIGGLFSHEEIGGTTEAGAVSAFQFVGVPGITVDELQREYPSVIAPTDGRQVNRSAFQAGCVLSWLAFSLASDGWYRRPLRETDDEGHVGGDVLRKDSCSCLAVRLMQERVVRVLEELRRRAAALVEPPLDGDGVRIDDEAVAAAVGSPAGAAFDVGSPPRETGLTPQEALASTVPAVNDHLRPAPAPASEGPPPASKRQRVREVPVPMPVHVPLGKTEPALAPQAAGSATGIGDGTADSSGQATPTVGGSGTSYARSDALSLAHSAAYAQASQ